MSINRTAQRPGYIFMVTVLVVGVITSATALSLMLLGWAAEQNGLAVAQSSQAFEYAQTCAERAIRSLRSDLYYAGNETATFTHGTCTIESIGGGGDEDRTICITGASGDNTRRIQIQLDTLFPAVTVRSWEEVSTLTLCP
jgi:hypothetical protein